uniref:trypco2 family protein n=1 Tax=Tessaracoccus sp. TaxID=1971211 RepID=UPI003450DB27
MTDKPDDAVAGLSEVLLALGDQLRQANHEVGIRRVYTAEDDPEFEPVLFFDHAEVELTVTATTSLEGGVKMWVLAGEGSRSNQRTDPAHGSPQRPSRARGRGRGIGERGCGAFPGSGLLMGAGRASGAALS